LVKLGDIEEITYVRLLPPTPKDLFKASRLLAESEFIFNEFEKIEDTELKIKEDLIKNALDIDQASKLFGKKISFKLDTSVEQEVSATPKDSAIKEVIADSDLKAIEALASKYDLPVPILKNIFQKVGLSELEEAIIREQNVCNLIKYTASLN